MICSVVGSRIAPLGSLRNSIPDQISYSSCTALQCLQWIENLYAKPICGQLEKTRCSLSTLPCLIGVSAKEANMIRVQPDLVELLTRFVPRVRHGRIIYRRQKASLKCHMALRSGQSLANLPGCGLLQLQKQVLLGDIEMTVDGSGPHALLDSLLVCDPGERVRRVLLIPTMGDRCTERGRSEWRLPWCARWTWVRVVVDSTRLGASGGSTG